MNPDRFVTIRCHIGFGHCCVRSSQVANQWFAAGAHSCRLRKTGSAHCCLRFRCCWVPCIPTVISQNCPWISIKYIFKETCDKYLLMTLSLYVCLKWFTLFKQVLMSCLHSWSNSCTPIERIYCFRSFVYVINVCIIWNYFDVAQNWYACY